MKRGALIFGYDVGMRFLVALLLGLLLIGCDQTGDVVVTPEPTVAVVVPLDTEVDGSESETPILVDESQSLRVWTTGVVSPFGDEPENIILAEQINEFRSRFPTMDFDIQEKKLTEQGGILNYLRSGHGIADGILPDVILISSDALPRAAAEGLILPTDALFDYDPLFSAAQDLSISGDSFYGYTFMLTDLHHVASVADVSLPANWVAFANSDNRFLFNATSEQGAYLLLQLYLSEGGGMAEADGRIELEAENLANALQLVEAARENEVIAAESRSGFARSEVWGLLRSGDVDVALVSAESYLENAPITINFAPVPGGNTTAPPLVRGWLWAITTDDPERQALAAEFIAYMAQVERLGEWSAVSNHLPANPDAFRMWEQNLYSAFLVEQLSKAEGIPSQMGRGSSAETILSNATLEMLVPGANPAETTQSILDQLAR